ncbi:MAG: hypothetical protein FJ087_20750, partial [Deltaproteobacteria bacterium]|nr:hypothetical protein [Deltaproteobacteria bacterium]
MAITSARVLVCACACALVAVVAACGSGGRTPSACPIYDVPLPDTAPPTDPGEAQLPDEEGDAWRDAEDPGPADPQPGEPSDAPPEAPQPGEFGAPCLANSDCMSGFCIESPTGYSCTRTCVEDCPAGWFCRSMLIGSDVVPLCVPEGVELCKPCKFDTQCGTGICMTVGDGTYCGRDCSSNACPTGYDCVEVPLGAGRGTTKQCKPISNACDCLVVSHGIERPCVRQNDIGKCLGIEHCDKDLGWVACTAVEAKPEECNAADDDCNGVADDDPAKPAPACTREVPGVGSCPCSWVCKGEAGWDKAGPVPAPEECNYVDDDCDSLVDEEFGSSDGLVFRYTHPEHCGTCGNACEGRIPFAQTIVCDATKATPACVVTECRQGYFKSGDFACLPQISNLCMPCADDANCGATGDRCLDLGAGKACGRNCLPGSPFGPDCPAGYKCKDYGASVAQCVPESETCDCTPANAGVVRVCANEAAGVGTCFGTETCDPAFGWVNCTARVPAVEVCNGLDDDCSGIPDDGLVAPPDCWKSWQDPKSGELYTCFSTPKCKEGGTGVTWVCEVRQPGPEACNYQDDNCDGVTDEDFKVPGTDQYGDLDNCGFCGVSCRDLVPHGTTKCDTTGGTPRCVVDQCETGYWKASDLSCAAFPESLCKPCGSDKACQVPGDACVPAGTGGSMHCLWDCSTESLHPPASPGGTACPEGYTCKAARGDGKLRCVPDSLTCDCLADDAGEVRLCQVANAHGTCLGQETCDPAAGWVGCTAATPAPETCNGVDDNCSGLTDEPFPDVGAVCWVGVGACRTAGTLRCNAPGDGVECSAVPGQPAGETCNWADDDCDGATDEDWPDKGKACEEGLGECHATGVLVCLGDGSGLDCDAAPGDPVLELCNGRDDDCDGDIDEAFPDKGTACSAGLGDCYRTGVWVCRADRLGTECDAPVVTGSGETCNGEDDDCDGKTDEDWTDKGTACSLGVGECVRPGVFVCRADGAGTECDAPVVSGTPERCNGKDDDCNGKTDDAFPDKGTSCTAGLGECYRTGVRVCSADGAATLCDAPVISGSPERCNGKDDDCDGQTDEDWTDKGTACEAGTGECYATGVRVCKADGAGTECNAPDLAGSIEQCNSRDDDCDGDTDEDWIEKGSACDAGIGECFRTGVFVCRADATGTECNAPVVAGRPEKCNARDDDCDGQTDETFSNKGAACSAGTGECFRTGVFVCAASQEATECNAPVVAGSG